MGGITPASRAWQDRVVRDGGVGRLGLLLELAATPRSRRAMDCSPLLHDEADLSEALPRPTEPRVAGLWVCPGEDDLGSNVA
jgi:hypothetical protein